tara:strand:+ start:187 stop:459 length:273 start_codon:yes stop_codon:yes gene_type:complete
MSYYEKRRLYAIREFFRLLTTDDYFRKNIADDLAELTDEVTNNCLHVVTGFEQQQIHNGDSDGLIVYDPPTGKHIEISFKYVDEGGSYEK